VADVARAFDVPLEALLRIRALHAKIDESAARISDGLGDRLRCGRGCSACCIDDLAVSVAEAARIVDESPDVLRSAAGPIGACAMLDEEGGCRVYEARPYVCRTQGLPLRWVERAENGEVLEHRDICPKNDAPASSGVPSPLEEIPEASCWTLGRAEQVLAAIDSLIPNGERGDTGASMDGHRVRLRALFELNLETPKNSVRDGSGVDGSKKRT